ncbi:helix-turn-helix domain-containing protein [Enterococcus hulanensis]|uniref:helix-turn-helix domain-containing protein n=1 Tax=Enterococcus hulanensis TaxID=2559929 RepID=UPI0028900FBC|nr:helix-turn-helix domain-containing protein [Enterococcus hulanensis]MDT2658781.1 helix-turn-helix domain-containing protein [Enterococcus hulanensis]
MKTTYSRVPFDVIVQAIDGDVVAINQIKEYFRPYMMQRSLRFLKDEVGQKHLVVDEVLSARLETRLLTKILAFKI